MKLLPPAQLLKTGPIDHADWNYRPFLGAIQRSRFRLALRLLDNRRVHRLLEIGYGSGVFLPELALHCDELYGIDVHQMAEPVSKVLAGSNVHAKLYTAGATKLPFPDGFMDGIVAVSSLEFVEELQQACTEIARVLARGGWLIVITPGHSPVLDLGLRILTGERAKPFYGLKREQLIPGLLQHFKVARELRIPWALSSLVCLYRGLRLVQPGQVA
ncbi:MAG: class I SAM-dependent methyltransferase [Acidobacteriia bacterium]|nr:class I SAM-dependent methyltransferase [Terriglobia bacterium]